MLFYFVLTCASVLLESGFVLSAAHSLPKNFIKCKRDSPDLDSCLKTAVIDAIKKMKTNGAPSLGVYPLDPLQVDELRIVSGTPSSPINLDLRFKNMKIHGISNTDMKDYKANVKDGHLLSVSYTPEIVIESDYVADGKVMVLPMKGKGKCTITLYDLKTTSELKFKTEQKNGQTYWDIQEYNTKFDPKKVKMDFEGLLGEDKTLNSGISNFLRENSDVVFEGLRPDMERSCSAVFKEIARRVFSKVPLDKVFD